MLNNRQKTLLLNLIASPFFIAIPIAILIIIFLPNPSSKYKIELKNKSVADKNGSKISFYDLNNDSIDECIVGFHNSVKGEASVKVLTNEGMNYDAWNFHGYYQKTSNNFYCTDIDDDGYGEIFVFYYKNDSVFLAVIQPYPNKKIIFSKKFITSIWTKDGNIDFSINNFTTYDLNNDGKNELIFLLNSGLSQQPRGIFCFDFFNGIITNTKSTGAFMSQMQITDLNDDSIAEIYCGSSTPGNIADSLSIPYSDYYSWFFGYNNKLEPLFSPIKNVYYPSSVNTCMYTDKESNNYIAVAFIDNKQRKQRIQFLDSNYNLYSEIEFTEAQIFKSNIITYFDNATIDGENYILLGIDNDEFTLINEKKQITKRKVFENAYGYRFQGDLDKDGKKEFFFTTSDFKLVIYDHNLRSPALLETNILPYAANWFSMGIKHNGNNQDEIYLKTDNYLRLFTYSPDYLYYLKYPIWLFVYVFIVFILYTTQRLQNLQTKRKLKIEETINSLQMRTIKSQLDPHFMFNVLNGLANNVAMGKTDQAYNQLINFSQLLRSLMKRTDKIDISLADEIAFVESYLKLEKFRFKEEFKFSISTNSEVDKSIRLPRMLIQLLVENSIKHGLRNKIGIKKLSILIQNKNNKATIIVEDNGIGRKAALKKNSETGRGIKLIREMILLNQRLGGKEISVVYMDLYNENGEATGTKVEVAIL